MVLNNEKRKQENVRRKDIFDGEVRARQERGIRNVLERGLKKKVLISNTTFDEHDDNIGEILEGNLNYDVDRLVEYFLDLIKMCGSIIKVPNGAKVSPRAICLGSEVVDSSMDLLGEKKGQIIYYSYLVYPEVVESFLNDIESLDNGFENLYNNGILVDVEDNRKYCDYIDFSNCYDVDITDITNYALLKHLMSLITVDNVKKYDNKDLVLIDRIYYNDFVLGYINKITNISEISMLNSTYKKGKVKKKKLNE